MDMTSLAMNTEERAAFLAEPHVAVLSVASNTDRPPLAVPIFYRHTPEGTFTFFTSTEGRMARKTELIRKAGALSVTVQREEYPYKYVRVEATLVGIEQPAPFDGVYEIARRYMPEDDARGFVESDLARTDCQLTLITVRPDRWETSDFSKSDR